MVAAFRLPNQNSLVLHLHKKSSVSIRFAFRRPKQLLHNQPSRVQVRIMSAQQLDFVRERFAYNFEEPMYLHRALKANGALCGHFGCAGDDAKLLAIFGDAILAMVLTDKWYAAGGSSGKLRPDSLRMVSSLHDAQPFVYTG